MLTATVVEKKIKESRRVKQGLQGRIQVASVAHIGHACTGAPNLLVANINLAGRKEDNLLGRKMPYTRVCNLRAKYEVYLCLWNGRRSCRLLSSPVVRRAFAISAVLLFLDVLRIEDDYMLFGLDAIRLSQTTTTSVARGVVKLYSAAAAVTPID
jgi:hypothetical protein